MSSPEHSTASESITPCFSHLFIVATQGPGTGDLINNAVCMGLISRNPNIPLEAGMDGSGKSLGPSSYVLRGYSVDSGVLEQEYAPKTKGFLLTPGGT